MLHLLKKIGAFLSPAPADITPDIADLAVATYAPFTQKLLQDGILVSKRNLPEYSGGVLSAHWITNHVNGIFVNARNEYSAYNTLAIIEHEAIHYNQRLSSDFYHLIAYRPEDYYKITLVQEFEAFGHEFYKFFVDAKNGNLDKKDFEVFYELTGPLFHCFVESYCKKQILPEAEAVWNHIETESKSRLKETGEVLSRFYQAFAASRYLKQGYLESGLQDVNLVCSALQTEGAEGLSKKSSCPIGDLMQLKFDFNRMSAHLGRNGNNPVSLMKKSEQQSFWQNLSHLESNEREQLKASSARVRSYLPG